MARPLRIHAPGEFYHVMSRGNAKQNIFRNGGDYKRYLQLLEHTTERFNVGCAAYCLMRNHVHLLLRPRSEPLCRLMQQLNSSYSQWFNRRHKKVGHVLEGRYRAHLIDSTEYFLRAVRYIVRNPVESGYVAKPADWRWSSCRATLEPPSERPQFLDLAHLWDILGDDRTSDHTERIAAYFAEQDYTLALNRLFVGSKAFLEKCDPLLDPSRRVRDFTLAERFATRPTLPEILPLWRDDRDRAVLRAFHEHRYTLKDIADHLRCPPKTVWSWMRRAKRVGSDLDFRKPHPAERGAFRKSRSDP